jgi:hypothetical protein
MRPDAHTQRPGVPTDRASACCPPQPDGGYLFHGRQDGAWQGVVQAPGLSLSLRLPTMLSCGSLMACAGRVSLGERERLKRGLRGSK